MAGWEGRDEYGNPIPYNYANNPSDPHGARLHNKE